MRSDEIDATFRPSPRASITAEEVDGVVVLYDEEYGACHELNAVATAIWTRLDGATTVAQLIDDLAAVYREDRLTIERDVLALMRHLGELRVLDGVTSRAETSSPETPRDT